MPRAGYLSAPTRVKQQYNVYNLLGSIGSFESGSWKLSTAEKEYTYIATAQKKYGSNSLQMKGDTSVPERTYVLRDSSGQVQPTLDPSHKYYVRIETYQQEATGSVDIYWPIAEPALIMGQSGPAGQWNAFSAIVDRSTFTSGAYSMRIDYNNGNADGAMWFDGLMFIDLTAIFGAGNEPDKATCDGIPFLDANTVALVNWWVPTEQPRARKIDKAYIGIPTKTTKKSYSVTNMVGKIGNFESADMSNSGEGYVYCNATHAKYGQRAMLLTGSVERIETTYILRQLNVGYVQPTLTPSHKYYARVEVYQETKAGTVDIYWPINEPSFFSGLSGPAGQWNMLSAVNTRDKFPAGNYQMRIDYNNQANAASMWFDGLMLVDLTATFGAGNEPDKAWCDANIPFTDSTVMVQWWDPTIVEVARAVKKTYIGDPDGKARLWFSSSEVWVLNAQVPVGSKSVVLGVGSLDEYTGGQFTVGADSTVYTGIVMDCSESGETSGWYFHSLRYKKTTGDYTFAIYEEVDSEGNMISLTVPENYRTLTFLPGHPPTGTLLTWLQANATKQ